MKRFKRISQVGGKVETFDFVSPRRSHGVHLGGADVVIATVGFASEQLVKNTEAKQVRAGRWSFFDHLAIPHGRSLELEDMLSSRTKPSHFLEDVGSFEGLQIF